MAINTVMESGTVVMVSIPETAHEMKAESVRLTKLGVTNIVFPSQKMADEWRRRIATLNAHYKAMELALQRKNDRNAKQRAQRRELAQTA